MADRFEQLTSSVSCIYQSIQKIQRQEICRNGLESENMEELQ